MQVAILIRKWSLRGGNERAAVELADQLVLKGHEVFVVCQKVDDTALDRPVLGSATSGVTCTHCGFEATGRAMFCPKCGMRLLHG